MTLPILYSFRRCPYAMRARLALVSAQCRVEFREIVLRDKPQQMIELSPKATVPVLQLPDGRVIDESFDIMQWALQINDPDNWLACASDESASILTWLLIETDMDGHFKRSLDRYKYFERFPERPMESYQSDGEVFIAKLENKLMGRDYLLGEGKTLVDMMVLPFVRQFSHVDGAWFAQRPYPNVQRWLADFVESDLFGVVMRKHQPWREGDVPIMFPHA